MVKKSALGTGLFAIKEFVLILVNSKFEISEGLVKQTIFLVDRVPDWTTNIGCKSLLVVEQVNQHVVALVHLFVRAFLVINTPLFVVLWAINDLFLFFMFHITETTEDVVRVGLAEVIGTRHYFMLEIHRLRVFNLRLPEVGHVFFIALTHGALVIVAESLLRPERALSFKIDLVSSEERCMLQSLHNGRDPMVQIFQLLYRCTGSIQVTLTDLSSTLGCHKRLREVFLKELAAV